MPTNKLSSQHRRYRCQLALGCGVLLAAIASHIAHDRLRGRVMATSAGTINSQSYCVQVRERCDSSWDKFILLHYILRDRSPDFEYWIELHQGFRVAASSNRFRGDSFSAESARIELVDKQGARVIFDHDTKETFVWQNFR